jgi:hypothetical protein
MADLNWIAKPQKKVKTGRLRAHATGKLEKGSRKARSVKF